MKKSTFILSLVLVYMLTSCGGPVAQIEQINTKAALPPSLNFRQLCPFVITSMVNKKQGTMATLYGNNTARSILMGNEQPNNTEVLALVTWKQQEDPHWFGGLMPAEPVSIEWVKATDKGAQQLSYSRLEGADLHQQTDTAENSTRLHYILNLHASVMP